MDYESDNESEYYDMYSDMFNKQTCTSKHKKTCLDIDVSTTVNYDKKIPSINNKAVMSSTERRLKFVRQQIDRLKNKNKGKDVNDIDSKVLDRFLEEEKTLLA